MSKNDIQYTSTGFCQNYYDHTFRRIDCNINTKTCTVSFQNGDTASFPAVVTVFNRQYGIAVCPDKAWIFMSDWDWGIYCYDAKTGHLNWKLRDSAVQGVFYSKDHLVAHKANNALQKINAATGKIEKHISSSVLESVFYISDRLVFVNRIGQYACLFDIEAFRIVKKYPKKIINPNACLTLIIQAAYIEDAALVIAGIEQYANRSYGNTIDGAVAFKRIVDSELLEYKNIG